MIEIVFSESACGSLKTAQISRNKIYSDNAVSLVIKKSDRAKSFQKQCRVMKRNVIPINGKVEDIYCFELALSVGDISENNIGHQRKKVMKRLYSFYCKEEKHLDKDFEMKKYALQSLIKRYEAGERIRIWYSDNPDELCGLYWLLSQLKPLESRTPIFLVKLPTWEYRENNTIISRQSWGEISPEEWNQYLSFQEQANHSFISVCAIRWLQLQKENFPLRVVLNGHLQSAPENFYDNFILREIEIQPSEFKMSVVIGNVLGKYQLGISDGWVAIRIEKMIDNGLLRVVDSTPINELNYQQTLKKCM